MLPRLCCNVKGYATNTGIPLEAAPLWDVPPRIHR
jgi:hypothetical protein